MQDHPILAAAVRSVLRPLVRILLRNGIPIWTFVDYAKQIYVDVAAREFGVEGRKPSVSRVSLLTGMTRKEVSRLWNAPAEGLQVDTSRYNRAARIVTAWLRERAYRDAKGQPSELPFEARGRSFSALVRRHGADVPARAVLDELLEAGVVARTAEGRVRLLTRAYVPRSDDREKLAILGTDVADLIATIDHNITHPPAQAFFQRKVAYDNLVAECLPELRARSGRRAQALLLALDRFMSQHDRDANPRVKGSGRHRAVLGIYYYEAPVTEEGSLDA
jgi:hypothetical protein